MAAQLRLSARRYGAMAAVMPKLYLAYSIWFWMSLIVNIIALVIMVSFWRAVYAATPTVGGLTVDQTINYILLAQIFAVGAGATNLLYEFGEGLREGRISMSLLRPVDFQSMLYVQSIVQLGLELLLQLPLALFAWVVYGLDLPSDLVTWLAFALTLLLGHAVLFCFDWIIACTAFYSTEIWGMSVVRHSIGIFFSGALIPLDMMPGWLQTLALALPFSQTVYLPVSLLSGIRSVSDMPRIWLIQVAMLVVLLPLSRLIFRRAVRVVTVQGG